MNSLSKILIAGSESLIGTALRRVMERQGYANLIAPTPNDLDLTDALRVDDFFARTAPEYVFYTAGLSGGIQANQKFPADLLLNNLLTACHVIESAHRHRVQKLLYLASSCCYPRHCSQPMQIASLLSAPLEPTNEAYAIGKIAGLKLCQAFNQQYQTNFIVAIPANAFGPGDDFNLENSHVIPALIRKIHHAKTIGAQSLKLWGTGAPRREFLFVDDLADACIFLMQHYEDSRPINVGYGTDISIKELAETIKKILHYSGKIQFDASQPDGMPQKLLDSGPLKALGWQAKTSLEQALTVTIDWYCQHKLELA